MLTQQLISAGALAGRAVRGNRVASLARVSLAR
jgi:hypothetical protein